MMSPQQRFAAGGWNVRQQQDPDHPGAPQAAPGAGPEWLAGPGPEAESGA